MYSCRFCGSYLRNNKDTGEFKKKCLAKHVYLPVSKFSTMFNTSAKLKNLQHAPSILQCHDWINVKNSWHFGGLFCIEYSHFYPPIIFGILDILFCCDTMRYTVAWNECIIISSALCDGDSFIKPVWHQYFEGKSWWYLHLQGTLRATVVTQKSWNFLAEKFPMLFCLFQAIFIIIVWEPNTLRPRGFRLCEPFGSYQVKIKESKLKIRSHRPIVHWILINIVKESW